MFVGVLMYLFFSITFQIGNQYLFKMFYYMTHQAGGKIAGYTKDHEDHIDHC